MERIFHSHCDLLVHILKRVAHKLQRPVILGCGPAQKDFVSNLGCKSGTAPSAVPPIVRPQSSAKGVRRKRGVLRRRTAPFSFTGMNQPDNWRGRWRAHLLTNVRKERATRSTILDLAFEPVGLPASASVSYLSLYRPSSGFGSSRAVIASPAVGRIRARTRSQGTDWMEKKIFWGSFFILGLAADLFLPLWWVLAATIPIGIVSWWIAYRSDWF